jgi:hypothetical protein
MRISIVTEKNPVQNGDRLHVAWMDCKEKGSGHIIGRRIYASIQISFYLQERSERGIDKPAG